LREYLATLFANDGWRETLDEYGVNLVFIETAAPLAVELRLEGDWEEVYGDGMAVIFVRRVDEG
jgi:hypothetical protein